MALLVASTMAAIDIERTSHLRIDDATSPQVDFASDPLSHALPLQSRDRERRFPKHNRSSALYSACVAWPSEPPGRKIGCANLRHSATDSDGRFGGQCLMVRRRPAAGPERL